MAPTPLRSIPARKGRADLARKALVTPDKITNDEVKILAAAVLRIDGSTAERDAIKVGG